jgi:hypothetical protein
VVSEKSSCRSTCTRTAAWSGVDLDDARLEQPSNIAFASRPKMRRCARRSCDRWMRRATSRHPPPGRPSTLEEHPVRDPEARDERLGQRRLEPRRRWPCPSATYPLLGRLLAHDALELHRIARRPSPRASQVLDDVLGRLRHDVPRRRSPRPARPAICWKSRTLRMAVFSPSNLQRRVKSTVRIGTFTPTPSVSVPLMMASSPLRELLDEQPVLGQEARVVQADAVRQEALHLLAVGRVEAHAAAAPPRWRASCSFVDEVLAHQVLRGLGAPSAA